MTKGSALIMCLSLAALTGCGKPAAKDSFARAEEEEKRARKTVESATAPQDLHAVYQSTVEAFEKVIADHPEDELAEASLFRIANIRNNDTKEPALAIDLYKRYVQLYPNGKQTPLSMFIIGYLYNNELHNLDSASAAYKRFLEKYPDNEMAMSAQYELNTLGKTPDELLPKTQEAEKPVPKKTHRKTT